MATKWKNSLLLIASVILCLGGWLLTTVSYNRQIFSESNRDYEEHVMRDAIYTEYFLKNDLETEKENITKEQIEMYRTRYGGMGTQLTDIQNQYQTKIDEAKASKDNKRVEELKKEKDKKIQAIIENFTDDNVVKDKIIKEEKDYVEKNKKKIAERIKYQVEDANKNYRYFYKDETGDIVLTNVLGLNKYSTKQEILDGLSEDKGNKVMVDKARGSIQSFGDADSNSLGLFLNEGQDFEGYSVIKKDSVYDKRIQKAIRDKERFSKLIWVGFFLMVVGVITLFFYLQSDIISGSLFSKGQRIPIDLKLLIFLVSGFFSAMITEAIHPYNYGGLENLQMYAVPIVLSIGLMTLSFISLKLIWWQLLPKHKTQTGKELVKSSLIYQVLNTVGNIFVKSPMAIKVLLVLCLLGVNAFVVLLIMTSFNYLNPIYLILNLLFLATEAWFLWKYSKVLTKLIKKPAEILLSQEQKVSDELSLAELSHQLEQIDEMIQASKKDSRQSEQLKTELLTNVSHDLRTPLTSIITYGELLNQPKTTTEDQKKYVEIINQKAKRMKHLIDDLFEVTKMNNGEIILEKSEVNLSQLLQQSVSEYSEELKEHDLKMVFNKPEKDLYATIDGERMWRVFDNLLVNVLKYAMPNTRVYLKIEEQHKQVRIELKNISEYELNENAKDLVEKFKRGDSSRHTEGSGLGLAIVNSIVVLHNGQMAIDVDGDMFKIVIRLPL